MSYRPVEIPHQGRRPATAAGAIDRLHLWSDHQALGSKGVISRQPDPVGYLKWLSGYWERISEWPGNSA